MPCLALASLSLSLSRSSEVDKIVVPEFGKDWLKKRYVFQALEQRRLIMESAMRSSTAGGRIGDKAADALNAFRRRPRP